MKHLSCYKWGRLNEKWHSSTVYGIGLSLDLNTVKLRLRSAFVEGYYPELSSKGKNELGWSDYRLTEVPGAIALTPSGNDNGLLTVNEILDLKLNAELVVLSVCNTGRGRITGDGVIGLSRSLMSAGASSLIVSLWLVPDRPTRLLMTEFYPHR